MDVEDEINDVIHIHNQYKINYSINLSLQTLIIIIF